MVTGYAVFGYINVRPVVLYVSLNKRKAEQFYKENKDAFFVETVQINNPVFQGTDIVEATIKILEKTI